MSEYFEKKLYSSQGKEYELDCGKFGDILSFMMMSIEEAQHSARREARAGRLPEIGYESSGRVLKVCAEVAEDDHRTVTKPLAELVLEESGSMKLSIKPLDNLAIDPLFLYAVGNAYKIRPKPS